MARIGVFGDIVFETSDKRILTFQGFQREVASRWAQHDVIRRKPASEFLGPELDTITFTVILNANLGVKPIAEMNKWLRYCRGGVAHTLVIGSSALGVDKWTVESASQMWDVIWNDGKVFSGKVDVSLKEYVEVLR